MKKNPPQIDEARRRAESWHYRLPKNTRREDVTTRRALELMKAANKIRDLVAELRANPKTQENDTRDIELVSAGVDAAKRIATRQLW